ncbi:MAG: imidazoleglycerol-phosphate dehydratase HisB [Deltaproteobacteria bacterium]|nr:imidazoleglycerol-phosphate dehydratase HisB [Deltaproteobacteria bacterium]
MKRTASINRNTTETQINISLDLDGQGDNNVSTGIAFFDHMLTLFTVHGFFDLNLAASGDLDVDLHHTVEDVGLVLGGAINKALGDRRGIKRYGHAVTPMDDALTSVTIDLSKRPFLVYNVPYTINASGTFDIQIAKEFFRAFTINGGMNLHINVLYGENQHHILESIFKATGRALDQASMYDERIKSVLSTKGSL